MPVPLDDPPLEPPAATELVGAAVDRALVDRHRPLVLGDGGDLVLVGLARDAALGLQVLITGKVAAGAFELGGVAFQRAFGLLQSGFVGTRVDLGQHLAGAHIAALLEVHADQLAAHLGEDGVAGPGLGRAEGVDGHLEVLGDRAGRGDGHGAGGARLGRLLVEDHPGQQRQGDQPQGAEHQSPTLGRHAAQIQPWSIHRRRASGRTQLIGSFRPMGGVEYRWFEPRRPAMPVRSLRATAIKPAWPVKVPSKLKPRPCGTLLEAVCGFISDSQIPEGRASNPPAMGRVTSGSRHRRSSTGCDSRTGS